MTASTRRVRAAAIGLLAATLAGCGPNSAPPPAPATTTTTAAVTATPGVRVYVTNEGSGTLTIIDAATRSAIATLPLGKRPRGIQVSPDRTRLYVALSGSPSAPPGVDEKTLPPPDRSADGIGEVDVATGKVLRVLQSGTDPEQLAITADGKRLFVANEDGARVSVFDLAANAVVKTIPVGAEPEGVTISPDGRVVYVTSEEAGEVYAIDTTSYAVLARIPVGHRPRSIGFTPDGARAFVTLENDGAVAAIDARAHTFDRIIPLGDRAVRPMGIAADPGGKAMYVTTGRYGSLFILDPATRQPAGSIKVGERPWGVAVTADGTLAFTANGPSNDVSVVDLTAKQVIAKIPVGERPWGVAIVTPANK
jgi:YVTN family beta-propeller protein